MQRRRLIECDASRYDEKKVYLGMPSMYCSYIPDQFSEEGATEIIPVFDVTVTIVPLYLAPLMIWVSKSKVRVWVHDGRYVHACTALALFLAGVFSRNARFLFGK